MPATTRPFGAWESPLTVEKLTSHTTARIGQLKSNGESLFWVEGRSQEGGRSVVVRYLNGNVLDVTPQPYSVGSRVHEYGGVSYCVDDSFLYFVFDKDQNLYKQSLANPSDVVQLTQTDDSERFVDPTIDKHRSRLICTRERHLDGGDVVNDIVSVDLGSGSVESLISGNDFYANARVSPAGSKLAYLSWDHPNMPWNGTQLCVLDLDSNTPQSSLIAGGQNESIFQPEWLANDTLVFCSDRDGFYNLYTFNEQGTVALTSDECEYGHAMWQVGSSQYAIVNEQVLIASPDYRSLTLLDTTLGMQTPIETEAAGYREPTTHKQGFAFIQSSDRSASSICVRDNFTDPPYQIKKAGDTPIAEEFIAIAELISYSGSQDEDVYAYFYRPTNTNFQAVDSERPPLLVQAHGGPTGRTSSAFSAEVQFYTSRGWAVLDVDYSGSAGYGRSYRDRLFNEWGNRDVQDLAAGVRHLIVEDLIDPQRVAIAGGSAGGYTVLRALTTSSVFKVGSSHYGIADLRILADDTHKFESRYIEQLVPINELDERSPINHIDQLSCPVIFSQGLEDKVVPPNQARMMFDALKEKGIPTALIMFEGEAHGFRKLENRVTCLKADYYFFSRVFKFEPHGIDESALDSAETAHLELL